MAEQNAIKTQQKRLDAIDQKEDREVLVGEKKYGDVIFGKVASLTRKIDTDAGITDERVKALPAFRKLKQDAMNTAHDELKNIDEKNIDAATKKLELTIRQLEVKFEKMKELTPLMDTFEKFQKMFGALPFLRDWMTLYTAIDPTKRAPPETMMKDMEKLMSIGGGYAPAGEMVKHMELDVVNLMGAYLRGDRATADMTIIVLSERLAFARRVTEHLPKIKEERKKIETSIREYESHNAALRTAISSGRPLQFMKGLEQSYLDGIKLMPALKSMTKWEKELTGETNGRVSVGYEKLLPNEVRKEVTFTTIAIDGQGKPKDMPANIPLTQEAMVRTEETLQGQLLMIRRGIYLTTKDQKYKSYFDQSQEKMTSRLIDDALQYLQDAQQADHQESPRSILEPLQASDFDGNQTKEIHQYMGIIAGNFDSIQRMQPENPIGAAQENSLFQKRVLSLRKKLGAGGVDANANTTTILGNEAQFLGTKLMNFSKLKEQSPKQHEAFTNILNTYLQQSRALSGQMLTQNPIIGEFQQQSVDAKQMFSGLSTTFQNLSVKIEKTGEGFSELDMDDIKKEITTFRSRTSYKFLKGSQAMSVLQEMKKYMSDPSLIPPKDLAMIKQAEQSILQSQMALQQIDQTCEQLMGMSGYGVGKNLILSHLKLIAKIAAAVIGAVVVGQVIAASGGLGIVAAGTGLGEKVLEFLAINALIGTGATAGSAIGDSLIEQNMNAFQKDQIIQSWVRNVAMSTAAGALSPLLGTGMGRVSATSMKMMQQSRLGFIRTAGANIEARALKQALAANAERHLSGNIFKNMLRETKEELFEEGLEATGRAIAPDDPSLGFAFSLLGSAYGHGKRVEGEKTMPRYVMSPSEHTTARQQYINNVRDGKADNYAGEIDDFLAMGRVVTDEQGILHITRGNETLSIPTSIPEGNIFRKYRKLFGNDFLKLKEFMRFLDDVHARPNGEKLLKAIGHCNTNNINILKVLVDLPNLENQEFLYHITKMVSIFENHPAIFRATGSLLDIALKIDKKAVEAVMEKLNNNNRREIFKKNPGMFGDILTLIVKGEFSYHASFYLNQCIDFSDNNADIFHILLSETKNESVDQSIFPRLYATHDVFRGNPEILQEYIKFLRNYPMIDQHGRSIPSLLVAAKVLYGDNVSTFKSLVRGLSSSSAHIAYDTALSEIISAHRKNPQLQELYERAKGMNESADMMVLITLLQRNFGNDIRRLARTLDSLTRETGRHIALTDLIRAEPIYSDNIDMFDALSNSLLHHGYHPDGLDELLKAKSMYQNDISLFRSFLEVAETGKYRAIQNLLGTLNALKKYPDFYPLIFEAAKHGKASVDLLVNYREIFGDNIIILRGFVDANITDGIEGMEAFAATLKIQSIIDGTSISPNYDPEIYQIMKHRSAYIAFLGRDSAIADFTNFLKMHAGRSAAITVKEYMRYKLFESSTHSADRENRGVVLLFPEYDISKGITRENWLYVLSIYSGSYDGGMIYGDVVSLMETGKNAMLDFMNELRDRVLKEGPEALAPHEKAALMNFAHSIPHYKMLERTAQFLLPFTPPETGDTAPHLASIRASCQSLFIKFAKRDRTNQARNINYAHSDLASFYEKIDAFRGNLPFTSDLLKTFDSLQEDRENFRLMQNHVLQGFASVARIASGNLATYMPRLTAISNELHAQITSTTDIAQQKVFLETCRKKLDNLLAETFESELGIHNLPPMTQEIMDHIMPHIAYLSNISESTPFKRDILSLFVLLNTTGKWDAFKRGEVLDLSPYFSGENLRALEAYLNNRTAHDIFAGVDPTFFGKLSEKTEAVMVGESGGIADTIGGIERHLGDLSDSDNFTTMEQKLLGILKKFGSKMVGKSLSERFRNPTYTDEVMVELGTLENEKDVLPTIQKITRILGSLLKFQESIGALDLTEKLQNLENSIKPSNAVIMAFQKIDVDMKSESGAKPIGDDIEHLESLLNKHREKLSDDEFTLANEYLAKVKQATMDLYVMKDTLTKEFMALQEASTKTKEMGERFKSRLEEFRKLLVVDASDKVITLRSTMTGNIEDVIGHIRQCLGCLTKEVNNDTNLTFGDRNRFLLITREFKMDPSQSLSDQLVTVLRTKEEGESEGRLSFVMDNVYGTRSPDILAVNVLTVLKKMKALKKSTGSKSIDIFVTDAALISCGLTMEHLEKKIHDEFGSTSMRRTTKNVTVEPSASGDGHYEIGGGFNGRTSPIMKSDGSLTATTGAVSGIAISL